MSWIIKAAELLDLSKGANAVDVGLWESMQGLMHKDVLFPHVMGGLRGRTLTVASINVSHFMKLLKKLLQFCILPFYYNLMWVTLYYPIFSFCKGICLLIYILVTLYHMLDDPVTFP